MRGLKGGKDTSASLSLKMCARCWSSYSTSRMGYNGYCVGGAILLQIDKQSVRVFKLIKFKLTLCSIAKFELLVMQYESTCIYRHKARINKRAKEVKPYGHVLGTWIEARDRSTTKPTKKRGSQLRSALWPRRDEPTIETFEWNTIPRPARYNP